jgi:hypothetical protein
LQCLILYGSWAKGTARNDSDIDFLAILRRLNKKTKELVDEIAAKTEKDRSITLVAVSIDDFNKEKSPLYTAIKKEGQIIYGNISMDINPEPPAIKYSEFFKKSAEFEQNKIRIAEEILKEKTDLCPIDLCFIASKHAIQVGLAMKGVGYSSKVAVLLSLTEKYLGKEIADAFRKLFELYIKSEYNMENLTSAKANLALENAKKIMQIYSMKFA